MCPRRGERFERFHAAFSVAVFCLEEFSDAWCDHIIFLEAFSYEASCAFAVCCSRLVMMGQTGCHMWRTFPAGRIFIW
jgi:hypothetical protein